MSLLSKPIRNYNIESRIQKVISKDKPVPAPKHKSDVIDYERILRGKNFESFFDSLFNLIFF